MKYMSEQLADGLGWAEGPAILSDGRVCFVETYRSQVSVWEKAKEFHNTHLQQAVQIVVYLVNLENFMYVKTVEPLGHGAPSKWFNLLFKL